MAIIKAIPTEYKGWQFRSRREARWAVCFDALGIAWEYEPEGYELDDDTWYLPDFYLPGWATWVEVKGKPPMRDEYIRAVKLAQGKPDDTVVITWEGFNDSGEARCLILWHDTDHVFHSEQGRDWLGIDRAHGIQAARRARFDQNYGEPFVPGYDELPY